MPMRLGIDADGLIVTPARGEAPSGPLAQLVELVVDRTLRLTTPPHSIYLHAGACATAPDGRLVLPQDVEVVVVLRRAGDVDTRRALTAIEIALEAESARLGGGAVELAVGSLDEVERSARRDVWRFWLRHCCRCVYGEDLGADVPRERPTWALARRLHGDIGRRTQDALDALVAADEHGVSAICRATARRLVWAGFGLVMTREESWTTDLDRCSELFSAHYPQWRRTVRELTELARHPSGDRERVFRPLLTFGSWLAGEYARGEGGGWLA